MRRLHKEKYGKFWLSISTPLPILVVVLVFAVGCGGSSSPTPVPSASPVNVYTGSDSDGPSNDPDVCGSYLPVVKVTGVSPSSGPVAGGGTVTIHGTGFARCSFAPPLVVFGHTRFPTIATYTNTEIVLYLPANIEAETVNVSVAVENPNYGNNGGNTKITVPNQDSSASKFTYK